MLPMVNLSSIFAVFGAGGAALLMIPALLARPLDEEKKPFKFEEPKFLTGKIFANDSERKNYLFKFTRQSTRSGLTLNVLREYSYPDGKLAARERLIYQGNNLVSYQLEELQIGAQGRAEIRRDPRRPGKDRILFEYSSDASSKSKSTDSEPLRNETLVNDMVAPFLVTHWDELIGGKEVKCRYIVVPRKETVGFTFKKQSGAPSDTNRHVRIKMEATSPIIAALIDPLYFIAEKDPPHRVLEYRGRTTPKLKSGSKWKDLDGVTVFDWPAER
jgi:hypothetical protein